MQRRRLNLLLNWGLLPPALAMFSTGLVLLLHFHVGQGAFAAVAFGVNKLVWVNVHRLSAALVIAGVIAHVTLHWRVFRSRFIRGTARKTRGPVDPELIMYSTFLIAALTGLIAWLILAGSSPLFGPAVIGRLSSTRHLWIDIHHISSLVLLVLIVHHVGHRWRSMACRTRPVAPCVSPCEGKCEALRIHNEQLTALHIAGYRKLVGISH